MWPLITLALAALLWLMQVTLGSDPELSGWLAEGAWLKPLAMGFSALALGLVLRRLLVHLLRGSHRFRVGSGSDLLQSVLSMLLFGVLALVFMGWGLGQDLGRLLATSALLSAIVGLALQPLLGHLFAGVSIEVERRLKVGDYVRRDELEGQIVSLGWRSVTLRTDRGSLVVMPNSDFTSRSLELVPREQPYRHLVPLQVSSEWPPGQVMRIVMQVLGSDLPGICSHPAPSVVLMSNDPGSGTLRYGARFYTTRFLDRGTLSSAFLERFWYAMSREGLAFETPPPWALWPPQGEAAPASDKASVASEATGQAPGGTPARVVPPVPVGARTTGRRGQGAALDAGRIGGLHSLSAQGREALLQAGRLQHFGRDERCGGPDFKLLLQGRLREVRPWKDEGSTEAAQAELEALLKALAEQPEPDGVACRLETAVMHQLVQQGSLVLGPVAQRLCARLGALTEDPWLAWQALAHSVDEPQARAALLQQAPAERSRTLHPGAWLVSGAVLGLTADARYCQASQGCTLMTWRPQVLHAVLQGLSQADQWAVGELLAWRAVGADGLSARQWAHWLVSPMPFQSV
ncbi:MAG: mechanosensitive ion channel [Curvibacter lanceolatus]|uniref:mechanosensitive ion channel family protein n=1 Tax=Curvibacter lanceolatus TaxID=86182 RepID=UPI0003722931|nr:mechanosensitive ion channel domain-containing protein [Curvibacter lanceolatus]MBV5291924.1 mechanosensitive ion channel [Curvibacter lanceolatus]